VASRKNFCLKVVNDLMSVAHIGIFALQQAHMPDGFASPTKSSPGKAAAAATAAAALAPHATLAEGRNISLGSAGAAAESPRDASQPAEAEFPAFEPPTFVRNESFSASPASFTSTPTGTAESAAFAVPPVPTHPLAFLAYVAGVVSGFSFEDDESMQLSVLLSRVINTRGAALQALMQRTIVQIKSLHAEHISEEEMELSQSLQLAQSPDGSLGEGAADASAAQDEEQLLSDLRLQGESAMAITILIRLRHWLQESYDLAGRYDEWLVTGQQQLGGRMEVTDEVRVALLTISLLFAAIQEHECCWWSFPRRCFCQQQQGTTASAQSEGQSAAPVPRPAAQRGAG